MDRMDWHRIGDGLVVDRMDWHRIGDGLVVNRYLADQTRISLSRIGLPV